MAGMIRAEVVSFSVENEWEEMMAIASAVQRNGFVNIYDEKGGIIAAVPAGNGGKDGLHGYTATTVSIRRGMFMYIYNEKGSLVRSIPAG